MKKLFLLLSFLTAGVFAAESTPAMRNVRDYGAAGDGKTLDTAAIQRAIDDGGIVHFPAGTYLSGTLYLNPAAVSTSRPARFCSQAQTRRTTMRAISVRKTAPTRPKRTGTHGKRK